MSADIDAMTVLYIGMLLTINTIIGCDYFSIIDTGIGLWESIFLLLGIWIALCCLYLVSKF